MVAPVTGPFYYNIANSIDAYRDKRVYRQVMPVDRPLNYYLDWSKDAKQVVGDKAYNGWGAIWFNSGGTAGSVANTQAGYTDVLNKSWDKLQSSIADSAEMAVNFAEYRQSMSMMIHRLGSIYQFTRKIRRLDFLGAARELGLSFKPKGVSLRKSFANNWLEYSFGWKPLIEDIYSAVDHLQNPIKTLRPVGKATATHYSLGESGSKSSGFYTGVSSFGLRFAKQGCNIEIENPNLYLANQLGLVNPATVVWELIPFSFVVDWFANVGDFLASGSAFMGLTVTKPWTMYGTAASGLDDRRNPYWTPKVNIRSWKVYHLRRYDSLVGPSLSVRPWKLWGWQRCFNAAAVLNQVLKH